jgi:hypothetical protein
VSLFRRRGRDNAAVAEAEGLPAGADEDESGGDGTSAQDDDADTTASGSARSPRPDGPWDAAERSDPQWYVDLGACGFVAVTAWSCASNSMRQPIRCPRRR